jgi:2',3'-cyclic-nucleotide 2'-phosphodiesterase (5'-nucleotidase family)
MKSGARWRILSALAMVLLLLTTLQDLTAVDNNDHEILDESVNSIQPLVWGDDVRVAQTIPDDDTQVASGKPDGNYGDSGSLYVQSASPSTSWGNERTWLRFSSDRLLPQGVQVRYAALRLYLYKADRNGDLTISCHHSTNTTWNEDDLTWNKQDGISATPLDTRIIPSGLEREWVEFNVTSQVADSDINLTLVIRAQNEDSSPMRTLNFDSKERDDRTAPRLRIFYKGDPEENDVLKVFHFGDIHSRLLPHDLDFPDENDISIFENAGGAAAFTTKMVELKDGSPDSLVLLSGDYFEGGLLGDFNGGQGTLDWFELLNSKLEDTGGKGIDAAVVGNHDIRNPDFISGMKSSSIDFISANIHDRSTGSPYFEPYKIVNTTNGRVGILGYSSDEYSDFGGSFSTSLEMVECVWSDEDPTTIDIREYTRELREDHGCDQVILLMHSGHSDLVVGDYPLLRVDEDIRPPELVVAGHWHTSTETAWQPSRLDYMTTVVEAGPYLQFIGEVDLNGDGHFIDGRTHPIRSDAITGDGDVNDLISDLMVELNNTGPDHDMNEVIGHTSVDLILDKDKWWTISEHPWYGDFTAGMWITDSMIFQAGEEGIDVDLAVQSGGGIRRDIAAGPITYREIYETYPWTDDRMVIVERTGRQIRDYLEEEDLSPALSAGWEVLSDDGVIHSIKVNGTPISNQTSYHVAISEYMFENEDWGSSSTTTQISIRDSVVSYTSGFNSSSPYSPTDPRYHVDDTQWSGQFRAVVTMMDDTESETIYETAFLRLLEATDSTVSRIGKYVPEGLVKSNGDINPFHQMSEVMWYRSHLGFNDGLLKPGDIVNIKVEGGFHDGNPQVLDQEGILGQGIEFEISGHDPSLVRADYISCFDDLDTDFNENHFIKFYGYRESESTVSDSRDDLRTLKDVGGFNDAILPGTYGELLMIDAILTSEGDSREIRVAGAEVVTHGFPPCSKISSKHPYEYTGSRIPLEASSNDADGKVESLEVFYSYSADNLSFTDPASARIFESEPYRFNFIFDEGGGYYSFYTRASDNRGNLEHIPVRPDLIIHVPYIPQLEIDEEVNLTAFEDEQFELEMNLTDPSVVRESYDLDLETNAPFLEINGSRLYGIPSSDHLGTWWISASVSDGNSQDSVNWTLEVLNMNDPPVLMFNGSRTIMEDTNFSAWFDVYDPDIDDTHTFDFSTNATFLSFNRTNGNISGIPDYYDAGSVWINATARDSSNETGTLNITLEVVERNDAPVIHTLPINITYQDMPYTLGLNGTDEENGTDVIWNLSTSSSFLKLKTEEMVIAGIPSASDVGNWTVNISLSDMTNLTTYLNFTLEVRPEGEMFLRYNHTMNITLEEDNITTVSVPGIFPEAYLDGLKFSKTGGANIILSQNGTILNIGGKADWNGIENISIRGTRSWMEIILNISVNVTPVNDLPVILNFDVEGNDTLGWPTTMTASVTDPDIPYGDSLTISWIQRFHGEIGTGESFTHTFQAGTHNITLRVTDTTGNFTERYFEVYKVPKNGGDGIDNPDKNKTDDDDGGVSVIAILLIVGAVDVVILAGIGLLIYLRNKKEEHDKERKREPLPRIDDKELMNQLGFTDTGRGAGRNTGFSSAPLPEDPAEEPVEPVPPGLNDMEVQDPGGQRMTDLGSESDSPIEGMEIPPGPHITESSGIPPGIHQMERISPGIDPFEGGIPPGPHAPSMNDMEGPPRQDVDPFNKGDIPSPSGELELNHVDDIQGKGEDPFQGEIPPGPHAAERGIKDSGIHDSSTFDDNDPEPSRQEPAQPPVDIPPGPHSRGGGIPIGDIPRPPSGDPIGGDSPKKKSDEQLEELDVLLDSLLEDSDI